MHNLTSRLSCFLPKAPQKAAPNENPLQTLNFPIYFYFYFQFCFRRFNFIILYFIPFSEKVRSNYSTSSFSRNTANWIESKMLFMIQPQKKNCSFSSGEVISNAVCSFSRKWRFMGESKYNLQSWRIFWSWHRQNWVVFCGAILHCNWIFVCGQNWIE